MSVCLGFLSFRICNNMAFLYAETRVFCVDDCFIIILFLFLFFLQYFAQYGAGLSLCNDLLQRAAELDPGHQDRAGGHER